ncbi:STE23, partial [Symbiodinium necroappetens]
DDRSHLLDKDETSRHCWGRHRCTLIATAVILLVGAAGLAMHSVGSRAHRGKSLLLTNKPKSDQRQYQYTELSNGLHVVNIQDENSHQMAMAMAQSPENPHERANKKGSYDVVGQLQFADPPSVDELRKRAAAGVPGSRFQLLRGSSVLKEDETVSGGTVERPVLLTLVILPAAGADGGAEVRPLVLEDPISEQMDILVHDMRTGEDSLLPLRYFLAADGKAHLGVLASEAAQMVGADPLAFASLATVSAVFPGEEQTQAALHDSVELWEVIGGAARDGILVRTGWSLSSPELSERLGKGAIIQQKDIRGDRLLYAKVSGSGPREGWVSLRSRGRGLLAKRAARKEPHRAVVKLLHLHTALATASSDWKRRHPVVELIQEICSRLEYLALTALPTDPRAQEAFTEAVKAGSHDDPRQLPGLAHFCEHMLFLGTEKYPENSGFDQFLMKYGGSSNAFTASEVTVYFAAASSDAAREGLDRFADFFRAPLFKQDASGDGIPAPQTSNCLGAPALERQIFSTCLSDIEVADFVALDLEFSGLFVDHQRGPQVLEAYFARCVESVPKFLALQLGLCCVQFQKEKQVWELRTHEFDLWPQDRRLFTVDLQSLQFLRTHGFDFNAFLERAHPYSRLPPLGHKLAGNAHVKATPVLQALRDAKVPVVLHNGLLDMLHLYDKFLGDLPADPESFGKAWVEHFSLLFDTRVLAQDGRLDVLQHAGGLSLETLQKHLQSELHGLSIERCTTIAKAAHSAGYDATVTAEVFLMEMDRWIRHVNQKAMPEEDAKEQHPNGRKRKRSSEGVEGLSCPSLLESHEACRRFHNRVALVSTSPGSMDLVPKEAEPGDPETTAG